MTRQLATIQEVNAIYPIEGKDRIVQYGINGWRVIDQVGKYNVGDLVVFLEVDSWVPNTLAPFLTKPGAFPKVYMGIEGQKLKTIKMGGAISQGLLLHPDAIPAAGIGEDVTEALGIIKWERAPEFMSANAKGTFPSFIRKTDQERIQNCYAKIPSGKYEVTEKLEGQSFTAYVRDDEFGICSRNQELKTDEPSTFADTAAKYEVIEYLQEFREKTGRNIAIQGEQVGPGIQGNIYGFDDVRLYVFDIFDIDKYEYMLCEERFDILSKYFPTLPVAPITRIVDIVNDDPKTTLKNLLELADGKTTLPAKKAVWREGEVYKNMHTNFTFKAISNLYLLKTDND